MEHIRYAVTHVPSHLAAPPPIENASESSTPAEPAETRAQYPDPATTYGIPQSFEPPRQDPSSLPKSSEPFQFGNRYLLPDSDVFSHNAWDHVEPDASYAAFSESQYAAQRASPASDFDRQRFNARPDKFWNLFYSNNKTNFFKDRKWLASEFPILERIARADSPPATLLEVGAGAGNTAFPVLKMSENPGLRIVACDFSKKAVDLIRGHELYDGDRLRAEVWDAAAAGDEGLPPGVGPESVDVVSMIFIFSALAPAQWARAVENVYHVLKPGGVVLFRDYGRGDLAQVRFRKGRWMGENFYVRGDGTRVYFFEKEELRDIWTGKATKAFTQKDGASESLATQVEKLNVKESSGQGTIGGERTESRDRVQSEEVQENGPSFEVVQLGVDRRMLVNRQRQLKMYRCWMQAVFRKPDPTGVSTTADIPLADIDNLPEDEQGDGESKNTPPG